MQNPFIKAILKLISEDAGCAIQYGGCPCNTCFHSWAGDTLKLSKNMAHLFWIVVLALRGDYKEQELIWDNKAMFKELVQGKLETKSKPCLKKKLKVKGNDQNQSHYHC